MLLRSAHTERIGRPKRFRGTPISLLRVRELLEHIKIIEVEGLGPGPFAGMMLADLGAEVIVVHRQKPSLSALPERNLIDRGKKSIVLDLKNAADIDILKQLICTADGLIEGFRPGVMERLGLGPEDTCKDNPRLVYGRMTGWGQHGPMACLAGHDLNYIGLSGALWYASPPGTSPLTPPTLTGDIGGGALYLVIGMLAGLLGAQQSGQGTVVDAAIVDGSAHMMNLLMSAQSAGLLNARRGTSFLDGAPWSRCYATSDGGWLSVQCLEPTFYGVFRRKLGIDTDSGFDQDEDSKSWPTIAKRLSEIFARKTLHDWTQLFADCDACVAPVLEPSAAAKHPHLAARKTWLEINGQLQARAAPRFDGKVPGDPAIAPMRGEHTDEILAGLNAI